ncbi:MAG: hypothetical protein AAF514_14600 [Verrucomicrobiota bacterium]
MTRRSTQALRFLDRHPFRTAVALVTLGALGWQFENLRGRLRWEKTQRALAAEGISLDWRSYHPSGPIRPEDNIADHPFFEGVPRQWMTDPQGNRTGISLGLDQIFPPFFEGLPEPLFHHSAPKEKTSWTDALIRVYPESADLLAATAQVEPLLAQLSEALQRPQCQWLPFDPAEQVSPIYSPNLPSISGPLEKLVFLVQARAAALLDLDRGEQAAKELQALLQFPRVFMSSTTVVEELVARVATSLTTDHLEEILLDPRWDESSLTVIQEGTNRPINHLHRQQNGFSYELAAANHWLEGLMNHEPWAPKPTRGISANHPLERRLQELQNVCFAVLPEIMPRGWWHQNLANGAEEWKTHLLSAYDPETDRVSPSRAPGRGRLFNGVITPTNFLVQTHYPDIYFYVQGTAETQTKSDLLVVLCALQRYRLRHEGYPTDLETLKAEGLLARIPHDYVTGKPPHYERNQTGFVLASLDWEQTGNPEDYLCRVTATSESRATVRP